MPFCCGKTTPLSSLEHRYVMGDKELENAQYAEKQHIDSELVLAIEEVEMEKQCKLDEVTRQAYLPPSELPVLARTRYEHGAVKLGEALGGMLFPFTTVIRIFLSVTLASARACLWLAYDDSTRLSPFWLFLTFLPSVDATSTHSIVDVEGRLDDTQRFAQLFAPWLILLFGIFCDIYLWKRSRQLRDKEPPLVTGVIMVIIAVVWCGFRSTELDSKRSWQPVTIACYLAFWSGFMVTSLGGMEQRKAFVLTVISSSGFASLLLTALWSFPRSPANDQSVWALYWSRNIQIGPAVLSGTSILLYFVFHYRQNEAGNQASASDGLVFPSQGQELDVLPVSNPPTRTTMSSPNDNPAPRPYLRWLWA